MKTRYRFISLVGSLVCFGGGVAYANGQSAPDDLLENTPPITVPAPSIQGQNLRTRYAMEFVPPSPGVDYKILRVTPDPTVGYDIMITGPRPELEPVEIDTGKEELPLDNN